jgi:uncharacterized protein (TIGR03435 family)
VRYLSVAAITVVLVWFNGTDADFQIAEAQFDAASIKRNASSEPGMRRHQTPGRETFENTSVDQLIREAYGTEDYQRLVNMPDWTKNERYDIVATYTVNARRTPTTRQSIRQMLQALLEERFALQAELGPAALHVEHIERPTEN